jgi:hypothetical protein
MAGKKNWPPCSSFPARSSLCIAPNIGVISVATPVLGFIRRDLGLILQKPSA